jgi:hypothetical protein
MYLWNCGSLCLQKNWVHKSPIRKVTNLRFAEVICGPLSFGYWAAHSSATLASANFEILEETSQLSDG